MQITSKMLNFTLSASNMFRPKKQSKLPSLTDSHLLMPGHKLSKLIKSGSLTSYKLCQLYVERIGLVQPVVNAMSQERFSKALEESQKVDELLAAFNKGKPESEFSADELELLKSPLLGVPVSIKESIMVEGMKNSCGIWDRRDVVADQDAVVVKNVRRLGMIPICTTNIPEGTMFWADCQNAIYGRSLNPYDQTRITGASSGGEGSLLGAGGSVIGIGSDIGGSLRIPAHYCGIFSHKPSPFLISPEGNFPAVKESRLRMFTLGPMTRYASDLRPMFKCLLSDKDNQLQDTYSTFQPNNIGSLRQSVLQKLDDNVDISQVKIYYFQFSESKLKGKRAINLDPELLEAQSELVDHFTSKFNCQAEAIDPDIYLDKILITWQCMLVGAGSPVRDSEFEEYELKKLFGIGNLALEFIKMPFGQSKHTKESLLALVLGSAVPNDAKKAYSLCERFEKVGADLRAEFLDRIGDNGVLLMPTLPTVAHKHHVSLVKTADLRFTCLSNVLQVPTTHATLRLDKKHQLPYGFSMMTRPYNDHLTIAMAEEIELTFGGWTPVSDATKASKSSSTTDKIPTGSQAGEKNQQTQLLADIETDRIAPVVQ